MARVIGVAAAFGAAACGGHETLQRPVSQVTVGVPTAEAGGGNVDVRLTRDDVVPTQDIPAPRAAVWALLPEVYREVGLAEPGLDRATWTARLQNHTMTRRIRDEAMATFMDCGAGQTGPHANTRRIRMTVQTALESLASGETRAHTRLDAVAVSLDGTSAVPMQCSSRGILERRINNMLVVRSAARAQPER